MEYKQPGAGAINFAADIIGDKTKAEALPIIRQLLRGDLHDEADKRIKRCGYCNYFYRDQTRPNNSRTCSPECKVSRDTLNRAIKRERAALLKPRKRTKRDENYVSWIEYPYWLDEYEMLKQTWKWEVSIEESHIQRINAARQRYAQTGGRKKSRYDAPEENHYKTRVRFVEYEEARKPGEVVTWFMEPEELERYKGDLAAVKKV